MTLQLCVHSLHLLKAAGVRIVIGNRRTLLSKSFANSDVWRNRKNSPEFSELSVTDLGNRLLQSLDKGQAVAPVDFDIYTNKLDEADAQYLTFFESVLKKFNLTQESLQKLSSTDHGIVRTMLSLDGVELLMKWLKDKYTYGLFLDRYSASILLNYLLISDNYRYAAVIGFDLAAGDSIGDEFGDVCAGLLLNGCSRRLAETIDNFVSNSETAADAEEEEEDDDDAEIEYVDFVRQPNYDDNFDIESERLQLGKSLWSIGRHLLSRMDASASSSAFSSSPQSASSSSSSSPAYGASSAAVDCALLGLAAYERPNRVRQLLSDWPNLASQSALADAERLLMSVPTLPDGEINRPGRRPLCDKSSVKDACDALRACVGVDADWRRELPAVGDALAAEAEAGESANLRLTYSKFNAERQAQLRAHNDWLRKRQLFRSVKADLSALVEEQEILTAFDNSKTINYDAWLAPRTKAERRMTSKKVWAKDLANVPRMVEEFYARQPATKQRPTTRRTKSDRLVLKEASKSEKFKPLKE